MFKLGDFVKEKYSVKNTNKKQGKKGKAGKRGSKSREPLPKLSMLGKGKF